MARWTASLLFDPSEPSAVGIGSVPMMAVIVEVAASESGDPRACGASDLGVGEGEGPGEAVMAASPIP